MAVDAGCGRGRIYDRRLWDYIRDYHKPHIYLDIGYPSGGIMGWMEARLCGLTSGLVSNDRSRDPGCERPVRTTHLQRRPREWRGPRHLCAWLPSASERVGKDEQAGSGPDQRALVLHQHLSGSAWVNSESLNVEELARGDGVDRLREWIRQHYLDAEVTQVGRSLSDLFRKLRRRPQQTRRSSTGFWPVWWSARQGHGGEFAS